jgi:hypothetical protein
MYSSFPQDLLLFVFFVFFHHALPSPHGSPKSGHTYFFP